MATDNFIAEYARLYVSSRIGYEPQDLGRACELWHLLKPQLNPGQSVLDCSAGRGTLLRLLAPYGIRCEATEAVPYLVEHELAPYAPRVLRYDQLTTLRPQTWDAVVSCAVLQCLETVDAIHAALSDMAALAARWLCICVELPPWYWVFDDGRCIEINRHIQPPAFWETSVSRVAEIVTAYRYHSSFIVLAATDKR